MNFTPVPKPAPRVKVPRKGPTARLRAKKARINVMVERALKSLVRDRDKVCRWPGCDCAQVMSEWSALEVAHLTAKGAGGDPQSKRTTLQSMILLCRWRHQGPFGLHAAQAKIVPRDKVNGTGGLCEFWQRRGIDGPWISAGVTSPPQRDEPPAPRNAREAAEDEDAKF